MSHESVENIIKKNKINPSHLVFVSFVSVLLNIVNLKLTHSLSHSCNHGCCQDRVIHLENRTSPKSSEPFEVIESFSPSLVKLKNPLASRKNGVRIPFKEGLHNHYEDSWYSNEGQESPYIPHLYGNDNGKPYNHEKLETARQTGIDEFQGKVNDDKHQIQLEGVLQICCDQDHHNHKIEKTNNLSLKSKPIHAMDREYETISGRSNLQAMILHMVFDIVASLGVLLSSVLIRFFDVYLLDSVCCLAISLIIFVSAIPMFYQSFQQIFRPDINFRCLFDDTIIIDYNDLNKRCLKLMKEGQCYLYLEIDAGFQKLITKENIDQFCKQNNFKGIIYQVN